MEVQKKKYKVSTLKSYIIPLALKKKFSSFNHVNESGIVNVVKVCFENNNNLLEIELNMKDTLPLST